MLGWIGNLFIVVGLWGIGNKWRPAFLFSMAGEGAWIVNANRRGDTALASICIIFFVMALRSYVLWSKSK